MQKLTDSQVLAVYKLGNHPLIDATLLNNHGGSVSFTISSKNDVDLSEILTDLNLILPVMAVEIKPYLTENNSKLYDVLSDGEVIACLHMNYTQTEKAPTAMGATEEITQPQFTIDASKIEDLIDFPLTDREKYLEYHESREDLGEAYGGGY